MLRAEQFLDPIDGELFDVVDDRVAAVVPLAGVPLGIFTAGDVKFSLAINCRPVVWRSTSRARSDCTSVSGSVSEGKGIGDPCLRNVASGA
jgi:hypothetical protein